MPRLTAKPTASEASYRDPSRTVPVTVRRDCFEGSLQMTWLERDLKGREEQCVHCGVVGIIGLPTLQSPLGYFDLPWGFCCVGLVYKPLAILFHGGKHRK